MTRKDYELIAATIAEQMDELNAKENTYRIDAQRQVLGKLAYAFADKFGKDNVAFNPTIFITKSKIK